jgi:hypothetical protein
MGGKQMKKLGITVLALTLAVLLAAPAMAASITPYASMRLGTYWVDHDFEDYPPTWTNDDDDEGLLFDIADIARLGFKGQVGDIFGHVEVGLTGDENRTEYDGGSAKFDQGLGVGENEVYTRLLYGKWDFGGGTLTVGQDYTPVTWTSDQQGPGIFDDVNAQSYDVQNAFIGVGCLWDSRRPQIRLNLDNGFYFALIQPEDEDPPGGAIGSDVDCTWPKVVTGFDFKGEGYHLRPGVAFQTYEIDTIASDDEDIDSWFFFLHGKVDMGAVTFKFTGHYGENLDNYGITGRTNPYAAGIDASSAFVQADGSVEDAECFGGFIQAAIPVDPCTVSFGVGYSSSENDDVSMFDHEDELMGYFVNCKIPIADSFTATPEFTYWDGMENEAGCDDPNHWALGITWQMDF